MRVGTWGPELVLGVKSAFLEENLELSTKRKMGIKCIKQQWQRMPRQEGEHV